MYLNFKHEIHPNDLNFKAYICHVQTYVYIHILNVMSPQKYMHEGTWLKGCICIINSLDKIDIYMKLKHMIIKQVQSREYKSNVWIIKTRLY